MTLAAESPDLDIVALLKGRVFYFAHHRGFTHSFAGLFLNAAVVVGFVYLFWRLRGRKRKDSDLPPRWGVLLAIAYVAGLSHILLDFTNSYGIRPFWPIWEKWFSWDIIFIYEPVMLVLLLAGLILPSLGALIREEIGARRRGPKGRMAALVALAGIVLLWGIRDYEHRVAVNALRQNTYRDAAPLRVSAYPYPTNIFRWSGVIETRNFFAIVPVDSTVSDLNLESRMRVRFKPEETPVTQAAKGSYLGRVYLDWAQYPITETERISDPPGYLVRFEDLRFEYPEMARRNPLAASAQLDDKLNVVGYSMGRR